MISILYSERDYEAANTALKVQSLSQNQPVSIYIVPKHYGRNEIDVYRKLDKTKAAIFIAVDGKKADDITLYELERLKNNKVPIKFIVPYRYNIDYFKPKESDIYRYYPNTTKNNLVRNLSNTIQELNSQVAAKDKDNTMAAIILAALLLLGLSTASKSSK
jgi:hypothetical protein